MRLDDLGRLGLEDLLQGCGATMSEPTIGEEREVDDSEFVTAECEATNVRREDDRVLQVRGGRETTKNPTRFGVGVRRDAESHRP